MFVSNHLGKNEENKSCTFEGLLRAFLCAFYNKTQRETIAAGLNNRHLALASLLKLRRQTGVGGGGQGATNPLWAQPAFQGVSPAGVRTLADQCRPHLCSWSLASLAYYGHIAHLRPTPNFPFL